MAELMEGGAFLSASLKVSFDKLASPQVLDFLRRKKIDKKMFDRLMELVTTVSVVFDDAEAKGVTHGEVERWLEELKDVIYHAEDVLAEIVTLASKQQKFDVKRVENIVDKMEYLASQKEHLGLCECVGDHTSKRGGLTTTSLVDACVYGRDDDKQKIVESLLMDVALGDPIPVITIVGMGGMGKTTLAKMVYNDEKVEEYFDMKAWVCVTQELNVILITKLVLEQIASSCYWDDTRLKSLQFKLKELLTGKRILLVLDDVWNEDYNKWRMLCNPFTTVSSGSKIIVTTRNESVASIMRTSHSHPVEQLSELSDENGWKLFAHHAFESRNCDDYPHLQVIGKQIVKKYKGLPLAIKTLGVVLRNKDDVKAWEGVMKSEIWDLPVGNNCILPALRLSYLYLPTHLKRCFAYCSIFPQDYEFEKEKLVLLWMAEGFVIDNIDKSMEEVGEEYFNELFSRSFFQKSSSSHGTFYVMHGLNRDLARDVSGKFCYTMELGRSKPHHLSKTVRHLSYSQGIYNVNNQFGLILNAKYLRTFLPVRPYTHNHCLPIAITRDLLLKLSCIRVLSLSSCGNVDELLDSICTLMHLRYLDLSHTTIKSLPNKICQLYNLQTLLLYKCENLIKLPTNLGDLVNLRHLNISETSLNKLPPRITRLESLQTLSTFIIGEGNCSGLEELNGLQHLKGSLSIKGLHNVKNVEYDIEPNLKGKMGIEQLSFEWGQGIEVSNNHSLILDKLQPNVEINHLTLVNYGDKSLSNWLGDGSLFNLTYLKISNCVHCLSLPSLGQLPSLVELHFERMTSVREVGFDFYGNGSSTVKPFEKLAILKFESMSKWEDWSPSRGVGNDDFPKLETLWIRNCPKLRGNLPKHLPLLRDLCIEGCGEITRKLLEINDFQSNSFPTLRKLKLEGSSCESMTSFRLGLFPNLDTLLISNCKNLKSFSIEDEDHENLKSLQILRIENCDKLINFPSGGLRTPNLVSLSVWQCKNLKSLPERMNTQLTSLRTLRMDACEEVESFPAGGLPSNLYSLRIMDCKKLMAKRREWDLHTLSSLGVLRIGGCSETETFPEAEWQLPTSITDVSIFNLLNLKTIDASRLPNFRSLQIWDCPNVKFNSKLRNTQDLPASFTSLSITDCPLMAKQVQSRNKDLIPDLRIEESFIFDEIFNNNDPVAK